MNIENILKYTVFMFCTKYESCIQNTSYRTAFVFTAFKHLYIIIVYTEF